MRKVELEEQNTELKNEKECLQGTIKTLRQIVDGKSWKMLVHALGIVVLSLIFSAIMGFSNSGEAINITYLLCAILLVAIVAAVASINEKDKGLIAGLAFGLVIVLFIVVTFGSATEGIRIIWSGVTLMIATIWIIFTSYNKTKDSASYARAILLVLIFIFVAIPNTYLWSFYHNTGQIERDQKIVNLLQIDSREKGITITLLSNYVSENKYMNQVLSLGWLEEEDYQVPWSIATRWSQGKKVWYELELNFPAWYLARTDSALLKEDPRIEEIMAKHQDDQPELSFSFGHIWNGYKETILVPLPKDPNS